MRQGFRRFCCAMTMAGVPWIASMSAAGPEWIEQGDAGSTTSTAQQVTGTLNRLRGTLFGASAVAGGPDFEDVYEIFINEPLTFQFDFSDSPLDFSLFLFNANGFGLLGNLDSPFGPNGGPAIGNESTDGTSVTITAPGVYYIAISGNGNVPQSINGNIFAFTQPFEISGPDGVGGGGPLLGWSGPGVVGEYDITMISGVVPAPSAAILLLSSLTPRRRRR